MKTTNEFHISNAYSRETNPEYCIERIQGNKEDVGGWSVCEHGYTHKKGIRWVVMEPRGKYRCGLGIKFETSLESLTISMKAYE